MDNGSGDITMDHLNGVDELVERFEALDLRLQGVFLERVKHSFDLQREARKKALLDELASLGVQPEVAAKPATTTVRRTVRPSTMLYKSKTDPEKSWVGRGKTPAWLVSEMDATGLGKEAFLVSGGAPA